MTTPAKTLWAYIAYALILTALTRTARLAPSFVARRLALEVPFVAFAVFLPLVGSGPRLEIGFLSLSTEGLWAAANVLLKATLGLWTTILVGATTPVAEILMGLERLRVPRAFTAIAGFMVRYADVITGEANRMRVARNSRAYNPRWLWQGRAVASSAGTLFLRSYERGERVYLAMVARGFSGAMPAAEVAAPPTREWLAALALPALGALVALAARATS